MDIRTYEYISHYSGNIFQLADKKGRIICMEGKKKDIAGFSVTWDGNPLLTLDLEIPREYNTQMEDFWWEAEDKTEHEKKNPNFCKMLDSLKNSLCREAQMLECNLFLRKEAC